MLLFVVVVMLVVMEFVLVVVGYCYYYLVMARNYYCWMEQYTVVGPWIVKMNEMRRMRNGL